MNQWTMNDCLDGSYRSLLIECPETILYLASLVERINATIHQWRCWIVNSCIAFCRSWMLESNANRDLYLQSNILYLIQPLFPETMGNIEGRERQYIQTMYIIQLEVHYIMYDSFDKSFLFHASMNLYQCILSWNKNDLSKDKKWEHDSRSRKT